MKTAEIFPTNTCPPTYDELAARTQFFSAFAPHVQLDIDDGKFAPEISWPYANQWKELNDKVDAREQLPLSEKLMYETHMMVTEPHDVGLALARMGCTRLIPHIEAFTSEESIRTTFSAWKLAGAKEFGLALLLETPLEAVFPFVNECNVIQLMSIASLGKQGAPFDERIYDRISVLHTRFPQAIISIDGGVSVSNIERLAQAGARRFGVGSAITKAPDPAAAYTQLLALASSAA